MAESMPALRNGNAEALLEVRGLKKYFPAGGLIGAWRAAGWVKAVDDITFTIGPGETLGLVGESGCGKTTTTKLILLLERPTAGSIHFEGRNVSDLRGKDLLAYRQAVQAVFQDPYSSLSPRMRVGDIIAEPLQVQGGLSRKVIRDRVAQSLELVGLSPDQARLFPHEFSGGQRQRIAIARALATSAHLIVLDEPVSALDVSIRAQIMTLLEDLQRQLGVSYLFIGHDLATVTHISHRIAVMYLGEIVEIGDSQELCANPKHPYTRALFNAALPTYPDDQQDELLVSGEVPSALNPPAGCRFHTRCPFAMPRCSVDPPVLKPLDGAGLVACHLYNR
jgi:oligopeptide transport system ATP-binding protein